MPVGAACGRDNIFRYSRFPQYFIGIYSRLFACIRGLYSFQFTCQSGANEFHYLLQRDFLTVGIGTALVFELA